MQIYEIMNHSITLSAFTLLTDIFRGYFGEWALDLADASFNADLAVLFEAGAIVAAPIPTAHFRFIPSDADLAAFDCFDPEYGVGGEREPRHADRFEIQAAA